MRKCSGKIHSRNVDSSVVYTDLPMSSATKKIYELREKNRSLKKATIFLTVVSILSITCLIFTSYFLMKFYKENKELKEDYQSVSDLYDLTSSELDMMKDNYVDLYTENESNIQELASIKESVQPIMEINETLSEQNQQLIEQADTYKAAVEEYQHRNELYDKYSYAIVRKNGSRTDLTYDQVETIESLSQEKGIDTDLVLSILMTESNGKEKASNPTSTARGYGQILANTGEFIYEKLLKRGNYDHSMAFNGDLNVEMMVTYLDYLERKDGGRLYTTIERYRGEGGDVLEGYIANIDKYLQKKEKSVQELASR